MSELFASFPVTNVRASFPVTNELKALRSSRLPDRTHGYLFLILLTQSGVSRSGSDVSPESVVALIKRPAQASMHWSQQSAVLKDFWSLPEQTWSPSVNRWAWLSQTRFTPAGRCVWRREEPPLISSGAPLWFCPRTPLQLWPWTAAKRSRRRDWKHLKTDAECLIRCCTYLIQTLERLSALKSSPHFDNVLVLKILGQYIYADFEEMFFTVILLNKETKNREIDMIVCISCHVSLREDYWVSVHLKTLGN